MTDRPKTDEERVEEERIEEERIEERFKYRLWQRCGNCAFSEAGEDDATLCMRRAPTIDKDGDGVWPVVHDEYWCGEWQYHADGCHGLTADECKQEIGIQYAGEEELIPPVSMKEPGE